MRGPQDEVIPLHAPFEIVLRGFNRQQVIDHIESLEGRIAMVAADRDAALRQVADLSKLLDHLRREAEEATTQVDRLQRSSLGGAGVRIQRMLQLAEDEITAMQVSTERETRALRERTRAEADRLLRETTSRCERLEAEYVRRINDYQTRCVAALHVLLRLAGQQLDRRVAEVEREVRRFTELRTDVTARLSTAHRALVEAVGEADQPASGEPGESPNGQPGRGGLTQTGAGQTPGWDG